MPMKTTQTVGVTMRGVDLESSGDSNGSDFGFTDDEDEDEDYEAYDDFSGSGDEGQS